MRLQAGIEAWTNALEGSGEKYEDDQDTMDTHEQQKAAYKLGGDPQIKKMLHDIRITNQIMYLHPSIEDCRYVLLQQLFAWQGMYGPDWILISRKIFLFYVQKNKSMDFDFTNFF